jgi:hypothetical protein
MNSQSTNDYGTNVQEESLFEVINQQTANEQAEAEIECLDELYPGRTGDE